MKRRGAPQIYRFSSKTRPSAALFLKTLKPRHFKECAGFSFAEKVSGKVKW